MNLIYRSFKLFVQEKHCSLTSSSLLPHLSLSCFSCSCAGAGKGSQEAVRVSFPEFGWYKARSGLRTVGA